MTHSISAARALGLALALAASLARIAGAEPVVVSTAWLAEHLHDPDLVVLHVASLKRDYDAGHVPGARYLWSGAFAQGTPEMSYEALPSPAIARTLASLGVGDRSHVVLCGVGGNVSVVARAFVTLDWLGLGERASVLDGQFDRWKAEGREVSKVAPTPAKGALHVSPRADVLVDAAYVSARLHAPGVTIVDARAPNYYAGASAGQPRAGHVPGARNLFFSTLVDSTNALLGETALHEKFAKAGVPDTGEIVAYCHVGQTASVVYLAARRLGRRVHLYDGSFDDWGGRLELPVETAPPDTTRR